MSASQIHLPNKKRICIHVDADVLEFFKEKAAGRGYQTLMNQALKHTMETDGVKHNLKTVVRNVIREEMRKAA